MISVVVFPGAIIKSGYLGIFFALQSEVELSGS